MTQNTTQSTAVALPPPKERRRLREAKSLTEKEVATAMGVTRATVRSWETGRTTPRGRKAEAYAKLLSGIETELRTEATRAERAERAAVRAAQERSAARDHHTYESRIQDRTAETDPAPPTTETETETEADADADANTDTDVRADTGTEPGTAVGAERPSTATPDQAFDALYAFAAPALVRQAYLLTGRRALSQESVERAFHLAWQRWPEVAVDRDPAGWVRAAAYEYAMSPWHRLRRAHRHPDPAAPGGGREGPGGRALHEALLALPPSYRRTLLLYDGLGLGLPETAAETEASTPAAANRLMHARGAVTDRLPELADPELLHEQLGVLARTVEPPALSPARSVRSGSERRARLWTRAAIAFTVLIVGATGFTLATAPTRYDPPQAPGERVGGVPVPSGPQRLSSQDLILRDQLRNEPMNGPHRLVPEAL
ncbi:sigma factor-like helix-turn-helix DNA-binding protein [Streptomyces sp. NPDC088554]|uniref:sigma factor-like helix-turn-helix DNA-binding protein n=1 Tax=Streptomyces sp. NPDC088554 TaxID=3365865 RepID=UPI00380D6EEF